MATLRFIFHGLLGFVLYKDQNEDIVSVLFPSQPRPDNAACSNPFVSEAHFPFLRFAKPLLDAHSPRRPQYGVVDASGNDDWILFLQAERLSIPNLSGGIVPVYDNTILPNAEKPVPNAPDFDRQKRDFRWAAHMEDACKGCGKADFDPLNNNALQLVEVVFDVRTGSLGCYKLVDECTKADGTKDSTTFRLPAKATLQALSETIFVETTIGGRLTLQSAPLPHISPMPPQHPDLWLNANASGLIECHVFNSELSEILKPASQGPQISKDPRDFVLLYELSGTRPPIGARSAPTSENVAACATAAGGGGGAGDHICPAGVFSG